MRLQPLELLFYTVLLSATSFAELDTTELSHANHVLNAVHSSMRQWGSSLNHNGMSFFLASVPAGTQLYHGTSSPDIVKGIEWLAFEPEHALVFARPRRGPPPDHGGRERVYDKTEPGPEPDTLDDLRLHAGSNILEDDYDNDIPEEDRVHDPSLEPAHHSKPPPVSRDDLQTPLGTIAPEHDAGFGYLHTYVPKHTLRLLYIDGMSAGKTGNGTLDTQDMLLLNISGLHGPMAGEFERARGLCNLTETLWQGKLDGIIRMEAGFEIIMCNFEKHMERLEVVSVNERSMQDPRAGVFGGWRYLQAVAARYHGIGGDRVALDFEHFVSVFAYGALPGLFENDVQSDYIMPRLQNVQITDRERIRDDVTNMVLQKDWAEIRRSKNWQSIADAIIERYSRPLHLLHTDEALRQDRRAMAKYLGALLRPFISANDRNGTIEQQRCVSQFVPTLPAHPHTATSLAHRALHAVTSHICDVLLTAFSTASTPVSCSTTTNSAAQLVGPLDELVDYLNWTTWKQCGTCADDEVCYIPIWPMGSHRDHAHPRCTTKSEASDRENYWGQFARGSRQQHKRRRQP